MNSKKKMGRPTDNPKTGLVKARIDDKTVEQLDECVSILSEQDEKMNRSVAIRMAIRLLHEKLKHPKG
jgi:hypothetical protein